MQGKFRLKPAHALAMKLCREFRPGCDRIKIAGSIRRRKPWVGDIEIVAVPKMASVDLFQVLNLSDPSCRTALDQILDAMKATGAIKAMKNGARYKQFLLVRSGMKLDLFLCEPDQFGLILALRTGPAEFSKRLVTDQRYGGYLEDRYILDGRLRSLAHTAPIATPTEQAFFNAIKLPWIHPRHR